MKRILTILALALPALLLAQAKVGQSVAQFLEMPVSARAEGMSGSFISVSDDISAIIYNPAGMAWQLSRQACFTHSVLYADMSHEFGAVSMPMAGGVMGVFFVGLNAGEMDETTPLYPEGTGRTFTAGDLSIGLSYSTRLTDRFAVGINAKYLGEYLADIHAHGWAMDIGTMYKTAFKDVRLGMKLSNFGPDIEFIQESAPLPMAFHFGAAGELIKNSTHRLTLDAEGSHPSDNLEKFQFGTEYAFKEMAFVRGGIKLNYDAEKFTLGAGVKYPVAGMFVRADYSFTYMEKLEHVHRFTLGAQF